MIPFAQATEVHAPKPAAQAEAPNIFDIAALETEKKTPGENADAWIPFKKETAPLQNTAAPPQPAVAAAPPAPVYTREDYEFSARQTAKLIGGCVTLVSSGANYAWREWKVRQLFPGMTQKEIAAETKRLYHKLDEKKLTEKEKNILDEFDEIFKKYDRIEKGMPFTEKEESDLQKALCDYQEYKKSTIDPKVMIWFTIGQILLKRANMVIFS